MIDLASLLLIFRICLRLNGSEDSSDVCHNLIVGGLNRGHGDATLYYIVGLHPLFQKNWMNATNFHNSFTLKLNARGKQHSSYWNISPVVSMKGFGDPLTLELGWLAHWGAFKALSVITYGVRRVAGLKARHVPSHPYECLHWILFFNHICW